MSSRSVLSHKPPATLQATIFFEGEHKKIEATKLLDKSSVYSIMDMLERHWRL